MTNIIKRRSELMMISKTNSKDIERLALFHIFASEPLYKIAERIYHFKDGYIKTNVLGYNKDEIEENLNMGEAWMNHCGLCGITLEESETSNCEECENIPKLSSTQETLVKIAFNLYNGYSEGMESLALELEKLDGKNLEIAKEAIDIRFGR